MYIYIRETRQFIANYLVNKKQIKKIFDMVKVTKSSPISKQSRAKNVCTTVYQSVTNFDLTAMPRRGRKITSIYGISPPTGGVAAGRGGITTTRMFGVKWPKAEGGIKQGSPLISQEASD